MVIYAYKLSPDVNLLDISRIVRPSSQMRCYARCIYSKDRGSNFRVSGRAKNIARNVQALNVPVD